MGKKGKNRRNVMKLLNEAIEDELSGDFGDGETSLNCAIDDNGINEPIQESLGNDMEIDPEESVYSLPIMNEGMEVDDVENIIYDEATIHSEEVECEIVEETGIDDIEIDLEG